MNQRSKKISTLLTFCAAFTFAVGTVFFSGCGGGGSPAVTNNRPAGNDSGNANANANNNAAGNANANAGNANANRPPRQIGPAGGAGGGRQIGPAGGAGGGRQIGPAGGTTAPPAATGGVAAAGPLIEGGLHNGLFPQVNPGFGQIGFAGGLGPNFSVPEVDLSQLNNNPGRGGVADAGTDSGGGDQPAPRKELSLLDYANYAFGTEDEKLGFNLLYGHLLVDDSAVDDFPMSWYAGLSQPRTAFRWGVGVIYTPRSFEGNPPVVGDPENVNIVEPADNSGRNGGRTGGRSGFGTGGGLAGGAGGGGSGDQPQNSPYRNLDTSSPEGALLYYTGDFGDQLLVQLEDRIKKGFYGPIVGELKKEAVAQTTANPRNRGGRRSTIGAGGGGSGLVDDTGGGGGNDGAAASSRLERLLGGSTATAPNSALTGTLIPGVMFIGVDKKAKLIEEAQLLGLDGLIVFSVSVASGNSPSSTTSAKLYNLHAKEGVRPDVATSGSLQHKKVAARRERGGDDPVESALNRILEPADNGFRAAPMPDLKPEHVEVRIGQLMSATHANPLLPAVEVVSFFRSGLLKEEYAVQALDRLLGEGTGAKLLSLEKTERMAALAPFIKPADLEKLAALQPDNPTTPANNRGNAGGGGGRFSTN